MNADNQQVGGTPYKGLSDHLAQATNGRVYVDPVTGNVGIGTPEVQRTWVGLTDEEKKNIFLKWYGKHWGYTSNIKSVMASVEAKLKQKNGYAEENKHECR